MENICDNFISTIILVIKACKLTFSDANQTFCFVLESFMFSVNDKYD